MRLYDEIIMKYVELENLIRKYDDKELKVYGYRRAISKALQLLINSEKWFMEADKIRREIYLRNNCHSEIDNCIVELGDVEECVKLYCDEKAKKFFIGE